MAWVFFIAAGIIALAHTAPAPFLLEAVNPKRSVWHVEPRPGEPPAIYLTFDDGPNARWTPPLLDALRETGASATFFLIDAYVDDTTASIVRRIAPGPRRKLAMCPERRTGAAKSLMDGKKATGLRVVPPKRPFRGRFHREGSRRATSRPLWVSASSFR